MTPTERCRHNLKSSIEVGQDINGIRRDNPPPLLDAPKQGGGYRESGKSSKIWPKC